MTSLFQDIEMETHVGGDHGSGFDRLSPAFTFETGDEEPDQSHVYHFRRRRSGHTGGSNSQQQYDDFTTIDWARDLSSEILRKKKDVRKRPRWQRVWDAASGWVLVLLTGILAGLCAGVIDIGADWLDDMKEGVCPKAFWLNKEHCCWAEELSMQQETCQQWQRWTQVFGMTDNSSDLDPSKGAYALRLAMYTIIAAVLAGMASLFVVHLAPYATGSGIPEVKTILSGFVIRGYFGFKTLVVKATGLVLAVAAGLCLGKEGPLVHVACCCGDLLCNLFEKYRNNEAKRREVLSAASAAGVSVAFGAPIGGVLFSLEEVSYYFPHKIMWRSFFAAMVAAVVLSNLNPFSSGHLVKFYVQFDYPWHWLEMIPFMLLGVFGGIFGAVFNRLNLAWCAFRRRSALNNYPILEVIVIAVITSLLAYPNEFTRPAMSEVISHLFDECESTNMTTLCVGDFHHTVTLLLLACLFHSILTVFTFGMKVPSGLFIPSMAVGATMGRVVGMLVQRFVQSHTTNAFVVTACPDLDTCVTPGLYAMVGAAATLGGVTRMTVSLVVIMFELTGGLIYILPLMVAILVSKWVGDAFAPDGIYDGHIALRGYPFLDPKHDYLRAALAGDIMQPPLASGTLPSVISAFDCRLSDIEELLDATSFNGYPLVNNNHERLLVGYITRKDLLAEIDSFASDPDITSASHVVFETDESGIFAIPQENAIPRAAGGRHQAHERYSRQVQDQQSVIDFSGIVQPLLSVPHNLPVSGVVDLFRRIGTREIAIVNAGKIVGLLTKKDIIRHLESVH
eukprot:m.42478 g.42478  ORF g.42478 m.42478 type:complete len:791 (-) comp10693_c0_seq2:209-2581(-)